MILAFILPIAICAHPLPGNGSRLPAPNSPTSPSGPIMQMMPIGDPYEDCGARNCKELTGAAKAKCDADCQNKYGNQD